MKNYFIYCLTILSCTIALAQKSSKQIVSSPKNSKDSPQRMDIQKTVALTPEVENSRIVYREQLHALIKKLHFARDKESKRTVINKIKQLREDMKRGYRKKDLMQLAKDSAHVTLKKPFASKDTMSKQILIEESAQTYHVPFASGPNHIELTVSNVSKLPSSGIRVRAVNVPSWLHSSPAEQAIAELLPGQETTVAFTFSVDKSAPVNKEQNIQFTISAPSGETWTKQIKILVAAPERFELYQNYPNPFNPVTVISYSLPVNSYVTLKVYNVLGEEVSTLVNETQDAGYKTVNFSAKGGSASGGDGANFPTGVYFYKLSAQRVVDDPTRRESSTGNFLKVGKMILAK